VYWSGAEGVESASAGGSEEIGSEATGAFAILGSIDIFGSSTGSEQLISCVFSIALVMDRADLSPKQSTL
jgi:hypothetical protein